MGRVLSVNINFVAVMMSLARIAATNIQISLNRRVIQMIEKLKNCPQCAGTLNEAGRCNFCGSKIYDFLTIDFNEPYMPSAKTYIRLKVKDKIVIAPIVVDTLGVNINSCDTDLSYNYNEYISRTGIPTMNVTFFITGDMIQIDEEEDHD